MSKRLLLLLLRVPTWGWCVLFALFFFVADDAWARVGGGQHYSGSRRSSGSRGSGGGGGGGGGGDLISLLFYVIFSALPWPLKLILVGIIIFVAYKARSHGGETSYGGDDDDDLPYTPFSPGASSDPSLPAVHHGGYHATLPPSFGLRGRSYDPNFSEVLFLERAVLLVTRCFEASPKKADLEALAPYVGPTAALALAARARSITGVSGVIIGRAAPFSCTKQKSEEGAVLEIKVRFHINRSVIGPTSTTYYSHEEWTFTRPIGAKQRAEEAIDRFGCPGCGAPLERDPMGRCTFCQTSLQPGAADWMVKMARVLEEMPRGPLLGEDVPEVGTDAPTALDANVEQQAARLLGGGERERFVKRARDIFLNLQSAWSKRDDNGLRPFETDALYQSHRFWIEEYKKQGKKNVVDQVQIKEIELCRVEKDGEHISATCRIHASCIDYTVEERSRRRLSGDMQKRRHFTEYWTFVKHAEAKGADDIKNCPSCGAPLKISQSGVCEYCQSKLTLGKFDWVASRIEQDEEIVAG